MVSSTNHMTEKERLLKTLHRRPVDRAPFVIPAGLVAAPLVGAPSFCKEDASSLAGLSVTMRHVTGAENLALPHTMRVLSSSLGGENDQPGGAHMEVDYPLEGVCQWRRLADTEPFGDRRVVATVECMEILSKGYPEVPVIGDVPAPLSLAVGLVSAEKVLLSAVREKEVLCSFLSFLTDIIEEYALALVEAGADVVFVKDEFSALLGERLFSAISLPFLNALAERVQKRVPVILHLCGEVASVVEAAGRSGVRGLSVDTVVSMAELRGALPETTLMGGVCVKALSGDEPFRQVESLLAATYDSMEAHIVAPSCGLMDRASLERLAMVKPMLF